MVEVRSEKLSLREIVRLTADAIIEVLDMIAVHVKDRRL